MTYTWVKRASEQDKQEMREVVDSYNELAYENADVHQYVPYYRLERGGDEWVMVCYVDYAVEGFEDLYTHGERRYAIGFVRCGFCGHIRELADGQIEFCTTCDADWNKPLQHQAKLLWDEFKADFTFMTRREARGFGQKVTNLAKKVSMEDAPTVMYLDNLALRLDMEIRFREQV